MTYFKNHEKYICLSKDLEFDNMSHHEVTGRLGKINEYNNDNDLTELNVLRNLKHLTE